MKTKRNNLENTINETVENIRKEGKLSEKAIRQLNLLERYYKIDRVNRIITIPFYYKDINEIIDTNITTSKYPVIKREILTIISSILHSIPIEFKIDVDIKIDNYRNYNKEIISQAIIDTFETFHYDIEREERISMLKVVALVVFGVVIFAWLFYLCSKHWFGESGDPTHDTIHEIIYTIGAVVLWEAVYIIFLPEKEYKDISYTILYRINSLSLFDKDNKLIKEINNKLISVQWIDKNRKDNTARKFLLITGTILICLGLANFTNIVEAFLIFKNNSILIPYIIFVIATSIVEFLAGAGAVSYYRDKGPFRSLVPVLGFFSFIINTGSIIYLSIIFDTLKQTAIKGIVSSSITIVIVILYYLSIARLDRNKKNK